MLYSDILIEIFCYVKSINSLSLKLTCKVFKNISDLVHDPSEGVDKLIKENKYECFKFLVDNKKIRVNKTLYERCVSYDLDEFTKVILRNSNFEKRYLRSFYYYDKCLIVMLEYVMSREDIRRINLGKLTSYYLNDNNFGNLMKCLTCPKCHHERTGILRILPQFLFEIYGSYIHFGVSDDDRDTDDEDICETGEDESID